MPHSFVLRLRDLMIKQDSDRRRQTDMFMNQTLQNRQTNGNNHPLSGLDENSLRDAVDEII